MPKRGEDAWGRGVVVEVVEEVRRPKSRCRFRRWWCFHSGWKKRKKACSRGGGAGSENGGGGGGRDGCVSRRGNSLMPWLVI